MSLTPFHILSSASLWQAVTKDGLVAAELAGCCAIVVHLGSIRNDMMHTRWLEATHPIHFFEKFALALDLKHEDSSQQLSPFMPVIMPSTTIAMLQYRVRV